MGFLVNPTNPSLNVSAVPPTAISAYPFSNTPTTTGQGSGSSSSTSFSETSGFNLPTTIKLPDWLTTDPNSLQKELKDQYGTAGSSIIDAANAEGKQARQSANMAYGQQMREGQNATAQQSAVSRQQGGTAKTSSIVAGQMAADAGKNRTDARVQIAQMKLGATEQAASLSSQIAGQMASLRASYLATLAGVNTSERGQDINQTQFASSQAQQAAQFAASLAAQKSAGNTGSNRNGNLIMGPKAPNETYSGLSGAGAGVYTGPTGFNNELAGFGG